MNCCRHILRKVRLQDDVVVQVFLQVFGTLIASMTIVHSEYLYLGPQFVRKFRLLGNGLNYIENNSNPVFIGFANETDVSVGGKRSHNTELLARSF